MKRILFSLAAVVLLFATFGFAKEPINSKSDQPQCKGHDASGQYVSPVVAPVMVDPADSQVRHYMQLAGEGAPMPTCTPGECQVKCGGQNCVFCDCGPEKEGKTTDAQNRGTSAGSAK